MTNKEKYRDSIESAIFTGHSFSYVNGEVHLCADSDCEKCDFDKANRRCSRCSLEKIKWLEAEYKEASETELEGYEKYRDIVRKHITTRECYEGISEECAELIKACMKLLRTYPSTKNWTPVTRADAYKNVIEEITDILCYFDVLGIPVKPASESEKWERWAYRVQNRKDKGAEE